MKVVICCSPNMHCNISELIKLLILIYAKKKQHWQRLKCQDRTKYVSVRYDNLCWSVGGRGLWAHELEQCGLRSRLFRWYKQAVTGRCILRLILASEKAGVCSGMERFNILKPNYTCPCIALYVYIESTESAYESSLFSWVNKKYSLAIHNIFEYF